LILDISLSDFQIAILIGLMLGDGCIINDHYYFEFQQCGEHSFYFQSIQLIFCNLYIKSAHLPGGKYELRIYNGIFKIWYSKWYDQNQSKTVAKDLVEKHFSSHTLVPWICDDGSYRSTNQLFLHSESFNLEDNNFLVNILRQNGINGIVETYKKIDKYYHRLKINLSQIKQRIMSIMPQSMLYKIYEDVGIFILSYLNHNQIEIIDQLYKNTTQGTTLTLTTDVDTRYYYCLFCKKDNQANTHFNLNHYINLEECIECGIIVGKLKNHTCNQTEHSQCELCGFTVNIRVLKRRKELLHNNIYD